MDKSPTRKVRVLRNFLIGEDIQEKGRIITVPVRLAGELLSMNKAELIDETAAPSLARDTIKKGGTEK